MSADDTTPGLPPPPPGASPSIFSAVQETGLRLESTRRPVNVLVVDHVERPAANESICDRSDTWLHHWNPGVVTAWVSIAFCSREKISAPVKLWKASQSVCFSKSRRR